MITLNRSTIDGLRSHGVYIIRRETEHLYIGRTKRGICRPFEPHHKAAQLAFAECSHLDFIQCASDIEADRLETQLIRKHRPKFNETHLNERASYKPRRLFTSANKRVNNIETPYKSCECTKYQGKHSFYCSVKD